MQYRVYHLTRTYLSIRLFDSRFSNLDQVEVCQERAKETPLYRAAIIYSSSLNENRLVVFDRTATKVDDLCLVPVVAYSALHDDLRF